MRLSPEKIKELREDLYGTDVVARKYICEQSLFLFSVYYFSEYFTYETPEFHHDFFQDFEDLAEGNIKSASWIAFRESAKTSIAQIGLIWLIVYKKKKYINVDSYDKNNSEHILFDIVQALQSNESILKDFGHLYNQKRTAEEATVKRISEFKTTTGLWVEAHSALQPVRGRKHGTLRPDFILRDDLENAITASSPQVTQKIIRMLNEAKSGMATHGVELNLGNYIVEEGVVSYIMKSVDRTRFIPVVNKKGEIAWPDKYVKTDAELLAVNKDLPKEKHKVSLEAKKRELNAGGMRVYEVEMLNDPIAAGSAFFDRRIIDLAIEKCIAPLEDKAGFWLWSVYKPSNAYAIGADTGKGNGGDHSTTTLIDFSVIPNRQVGSYANNLIPADQFAYELKRQGDMFGTCLIAPEKNAESGGSCLTTLKMIYPVDLIYRRIPMDRIADKPLGTGELGWDTNGSTKYTMLNALKSAFESGGLIIEDERILKEMRSFTYTDADDLGSARIGHATRHFDMLISTAIANMMAKHAVAKPVVQEYIQTPYETGGL